MHQVGDYLYWYDIQAEIPKNQPSLVGLLKTELRDKYSRAEGLRLLTGSTNI
jgi:hypothetical protein